MRTLKIQRSWNEKMCRIFRVQILRHPSGSVLTDKINTPVFSWSRAQEHERRLGHSDRTVLPMPSAVSNLTFIREGEIHGAVVLLVVSSTGARMAPTSDRTWA